MGAPESSSGASRIPNDLPAPCQENRVGGTRDELALRGTRGLGSGNEHELAGDVTGLPYAVSLGDVVEHE
jgi:hypothetical protein